MKCLTFNPSFFVKKNTRVSTADSNCLFLYKNKEANLIIDGELDLRGDNNNITLHAKNIIVTPRGSVMSKNINFIAEEGVVVHGRVKAKALDINSPYLAAISGAKCRWFELRSQLVMKVMLTKHLKNEFQ